MKVHLLENTISRFITAEINNEGTAWSYPHSMVQHFHVHWSAPQPLTLRDVYDQCLRSEYTQRWWKREHYRPKEIMMSLIEADPELASIAWKDLSNDTSALDGRLSRFDYYCNELLQIHRQNNPGSVESYHHQDASIMSLYLAGIYPDKYALYPGLEIFSNFCKAIGSPDIPKIDDLVRYMKVVSIVFTFLQRNTDFEKLKKYRETQMAKVNLIPFQITYEIIHFEGKPNDARTYGF